MHELSIARNIVDAACAAGGELARIDEVRVRVGCLAMVNAEQLAFCFEVAAKDTKAGKARLAVELAPARARCARGHVAEALVEELTVEAMAPLLRCGACGEPVTVEGGRDIVLVQITGE